jgi:murein hydrolase activator
VARVTVPPGRSRPVVGGPIPLVLGLVVALVAMLAPQGLAGQTAADLRREIQESQRRLEEIRSERTRLQSEMNQLRSRVRNVSSELQNIERQISASRSVVSEIDFQLEANAERIRLVTSDLIRTRERARERNAVLQRRLRDIYKRGPLHEVRVLLGAGSFAELLSRYRYLEVVGRYDRLLVDQVRSLETALVEQTRELQENIAELERLRETKLGEVAELRQVELDHQRTLTTFRSREQQAVSRLDQLEEDERRMTSLVSDLDRRRREAEARAAAAGAPAPGPSTLASNDAGALEWPVDGDLVYRFGRETRPNGTVLRWNGIGIRAARGTPVRAVRGGTVVMAGPFEGYGPTVVLSHGDGFYTLYLYLEELGVVEGRTVNAGDVVGTVGGSETPEGSRLEFQIRVPQQSGGAPTAVDPLRWLRPR